jgi:hypothetical protein
MYLIVLVFGGTYLIQESFFIFQVLDIEASNFLSGFDISINGNLFIHSGGSISFSGACDPREGTRGSGIIRFGEESDWPLIWNAQFGLSQDSWLPATDYPRASRSFPRIGERDCPVAML